MDGTGVREGACREGGGGAGRGLTGLRSAADARGEQRDGTGTCRPNEAEITAVSAERRYIPTDTAEGD